MTFFGRLWKSSVFLYSPELSSMNFSTIKTVWRVGLRGFWICCWFMGMVSVDAI